MRQVKKILVAALLVVMWSTSAQAALGWFTVQVIHAGKAGDPTVLIQLTHNKAFPSFTNKWFRAKLGVENEMLAVALTAITADLLVTVRLDPFAAAPPEIKQMYLKK